jgi:methylated-DNA-[protein]-cysteine S-methyltransferase
MREIERQLQDATGGPGAAAPAAEAAARRLGGAALEAGLVDVGYATVDSPLGPLLAAATPRGLVRLVYDHMPPEAVLEDLARRISPRVLEAPARLDGARRELTEYFEGERREFDLAIDWRLVAGGFTGRVLRATAALPFGSTATYRDVATRAGSPAGTRAAGNALGSNPVPIVVPCHRILRTGGGLGGYTGGIGRKAFLLELERAPGAGG